MSTYTCVPANQLTFRQLARLINYAYADYYMSVKLDNGQFEQMCFEEDMCLDQSVVALDAHGDPVGLTMLSIRDAAGWISGVGVLPQHRRRGVAREMVTAVIRNARMCAIHDLRLEVLTQNTRALPLYESLGFVKLRDLLVLSQTYMAPLHETQYAECPEIDVDTALEHFGNFHHIRASWQREQRSLQHRAQRLSALGYIHQDTVLGYVLYEPRADVFAIADIAVSHGAPDREQIATRLLQAVQYRLPGAVGYTINIPAEDPLVEVFFSLHYQVWHQQFEMIYRP